MSQFDKDMIGPDTEHHVTDGGVTKVNGNAETELPEFDIHVETCIMEDIDAGRQVVMWKASTENEIARSSTPMEAVMEVIERETGGVI